MPVPNLVSAKVVLLLSSTALIRQINCAYSPDIELGQVEEVDNLEPLLRDGDLSTRPNSTKYEYSLENLDADSQLPSCSTTDENYHSSDETASVVDNRLLSSEGNTSDGEDLETMSNRDNNTETDLHTAVKLINKDVVEELLENGASVACLNEGGETPLHVCVRMRLEDILEILVKKGPDVQDHNGQTVLQAAVDENWLPGVRVALDGGADITTTDGRTPLHSAILNAHKDIIKLLLKKEPNLAALVPKNIKDSENSETIIDMIIHNVPEPTEFLKEVLDSYISLDGSTTNRVKIDYGILMPRKSVKKEMDVIETLLRTGNEYDQQELVLHPLIESFIYLKWQAVRHYYFQITGLHIIFMILLTAYTLSVFYFKDTYGTKYEWPYLMSRGALIYLCIILTILQELFMNFKKNFIMYFMNRKNWVQFGSLGLASILPPSLLVQENGDAEWPRHLATGALLLTWIQMLIILAQYPRWGYYVVMFEKVAINVIKILGTFFFLIFGFAIAFMIQFRSKEPFDGLWNAFVKTLFLGIGEFEYNAVFNSENYAKLGYSFQVLRVIFVLFLFLVAIVLMNMMFGVAVDDINELKSDGDIGRLVKQAAFVTSLDTLDYNLTKKVLHIPDEDRQKYKYLRQLFPRIHFLGKVNFKSKTDNNIRVMPKHLREAFFNIAHKNKEEEENQKSKDDETEVESCMVKKQDDYYENILTRIDQLELTINTKLDLLRKDLLITKQLLLRSKR